VQIEINDLGKRYGDGKWALRGVSATLRAGSFVALIGANGAGKTTLIHLLCGLLDPSEGGVAVPAGLCLGWCSQQAVIDWYLSAYDNVLLGARFAGLGAKASRELSERALAAVQLLDVAHRPVDELSGGQQQRVQIARAMVHQPDLLLLDEPTTGLDPQAAEALLETLRARAQAGAFVLVSSHDLTLLERYCDEVLLLADGQLLAFEPRADFLERFASEEIIRVAYRGALAPADLARIRARVLRVTTESPLEVVVKRGFPVMEVLSLMGGVTVTDLERQVPGLREAYLKLAQGVPGE